MARKKKNKSKLKPIHQFAIFAFIIALAQLAFIFYFSGNKILTENQAIDKTVALTANLDDRGKIQSKIQLALITYRTTNGNNWPASLGDLVPKYFDAVPVDPVTSKPFSYRLDKNKTFVGEDGEKILLAKTGKAGGADLSKEDLLIASIKQASLDPDYVYDPTGKRDPFRPFQIAPKIQQEVDTSSLTPLEKYDLGQLKLTAVLESSTDPTAIVENAQGRGFTVKKGTKIGTSRGVVVDILDDRLLILETEIDLTGQTKTRTQEMRLRTKDQEETMQQ